LLCFALLCLALLALLGFVVLWGNMARRTT
jgi:hypothetical protein